MIVMTEMERWLDVVDYEGYYQVSNLGRVRSLDRGAYFRQDRYKNPRWVNRKGKILKEYARSGNQRRIVILSILGVPKSFSVHRLVAIAHLPNPNNYPVVNHINHDYLDNRASNLEWCTQKHNIRHAIAAGRMNHIYKGDPAVTKITRKQATNAKRLLALGWANSKVAKQVGIGYDAVYHISKGHTWRHI